MSGPALTFRKEFQGVAARQFSIKPVLSSGGGEDRARIVLSASPSELPESREGWSVTISPNLTRGAALTDLTVRPFILLRFFP